jgi:hypothetical protein
MERRAAFFPVPGFARTAFRVAGEEPRVGSAGREAAGAAALDDMPPKKPPNWVTITISNTTPRETAAISFVRLSAPNFTTLASNKFRI